MKFPFRAVAIAAAPFVLAATAAWAAPFADAQPTNFVPADHGAAMMEENDVALNAAEPQAAAIVADGALSILQHATAAFGRDGAETPPRKLTLDELVLAYADSETADAEQECLAGAVYFEARGEPIDGQLAVAEVVLNRAASGRYPSSICAVVTQPAQFSFIRRGRFPQADRNCDAWRKAVAIARIASAGLADRIGPEVLWYHAAYVSPSWGRRLNREARIGLHIFYS